LIFKFPISPGASGPNYSRRSSLEDIVFRADLTGGHQDASLKFGQNNDASLRLSRALVVANSTNNNTIETCKTADGIGGSAVGSGSGVANVMGMANETAIKNEIARMG
jgi:hypothetical protein